MPRRSPRSPGNTASSAHTTDLDAALEEPQGRSLLRRRHHPDARRPADQGDRGRQARLLREAGRRHARQGARGRAPRQAEESQERRGAGQIVSARPAQDQDAARRRLLRPHVRACAASSATGCSKAIGASRRSGRAGTTRRPKAAASFSTCSATGATCSTTCSARCKAVSCLGATHIPKRVDENGKTYDADADDAAYATFQLEGGVIAHMNSSWCVRVRRDDLVTFQVDGTHGSAVAGLTQVPRAIARKDAAAGVESGRAADHELLLAVGRGRRTTRLTTTASSCSGRISSATSAPDTPWHHGLIEGVKGVQLAELGLQSWKERRWLDVPEHQDLRSREWRRSPADRGPQLATLRHGRADRVSVQGRRREFQPRRLCRRARGGRSARRHRPVARHRHRLGQDHRLPQLSLGPRPRRRRGDGHRAARRRARLAGGQATDPPFAGGGESAAGREDLLRRRHRSSRRRAERRRSTTSSAPTRSRSRRSRRWAGDWC